MNGSHNLCDDLPYILQSKIPIHCLLQRNRSRLYGKNTGKSHLVQYFARLHTTAYGNYRDSLLFRITQNSAQCFAHTGLFVQFPFKASLAELAESIRQQGVLQPIGVRPIVDTDRFEIIFGERRYRAALMAELTEIPAVILHVSDETAAEMAVTENLQRKDVTPIEEANAYQKLMESGRYDVQSLAVQFGKNENYIRTRLKFVSLIPEIAELLEKDEITISVASEICRYGTDIQKEVYYKHLKDSDSMLYDCWRGLKAAEVAKFIERDFTTDLSRYAFDKTLCASCPHNTNNMMLFCEGGCGNCANRSCLAEMNASYLVEKALQFVEQYPSVSLGYQDFNNNMLAVERLTAMGYEVEHLNTYATAYPETPVAPEKEEYDTTEEYEAAYKEYRADIYI